MRIIFHESAGTLEDKRKNMPKLIPRDLQMQFEHVTCLKCSAVWQRINKTLFLKQNRVLRGWKNTLKLLSYSWLPKTNCGSEIEMLYFVAGQGATSQSLKKLTIYFASFWVLLIFNRIALRVQEHRYVVVFGPSRSSARLGPVLAWAVGEKSSALFGSSCLQKSSAGLAMPWKNFGSAQLA